MDIVVVGSIALDTIVTPSGSAEECVGGSATYFSLAASYFAPVRLVAVVGSDFPAEARATLESRGVDCEGLEVVPGRTFRWGGRYEEDMNDRVTLFTELNVFEGFHPKLPASYGDTEMVFLANIHPDLQLEVLDQVSSPRLVAMDTMNLWIETARPSLLGVLARIDLLFVNEEEVRQLSGRRQLVDAVAAVRAMGPRTVVVKKGEHGAVLFGEGFRFALPAVLLDRVADPTGAGDTFAGGFLGHLAREGRTGEEELRRAMVHGTVMASFVAERFSVEGLADLAPAAIEERYGELAALTRWERG